jgi:RHS repeat-associated protein
LGRATIATPGIHLLTRADKMRSPWRPGNGRWPKKVKRAVFCRVQTGLRFYSPRLGRWVSRDPIGEQGGINVCAFAGNRSPYRVDALGLKTTPDPTALRFAWLACIGNMLKRDTDRLLARLEQDQRARDLLFPQTGNRSFETVSQEWEHIGAPAHANFVQDYANPSEWAVVPFPRNGQSPVGAPLVIAHDLFWNNGSIGSAVATLWHEPYHRVVGAGHDVRLPDVRDPVDTASAAGWGTTVATGTPTRTVDFAVVIEDALSRAENMALAERIPRPYTCSGIVCGVIHVTNVMQHYMCLCDPCKQTN